MFSTKYITTEGISLLTSAISSEHTLNWTGVKTSNYDTTGWSDGAYKALTSIH